LEKFIDVQSDTIKAEYYSIVEQLETNGKLQMPFAEKIAKTDLFVIRVINAGNIRVFYIYGLSDKVYGLHGYVKKTRKIPKKEMDKAVRIMKLLKQKGDVK
jgi:phage-related protein